MVEVKCLGILWMMCMLCYISSDEKGIKSAVGRAG